MFCDCSLVAEVGTAHQGKHVEPHALDFCAGRLKGVGVTRHSILREGLARGLCGFPIEGKWVFPVIFRPALCLMRVPCLIELCVVRSLFTFYDCFGHTVTHRPA